MFKCLKCGKSDMCQECEIELDDFFSAKDHIHVITDESTKEQDK